MFDICYENTLYLHKAICNDNNQISLARYQGYCVALIVFPVFLAYFVICALHPRMIEVEIEHTTVGTSIKEAYR